MVQYHPASCGSTQQRRMSPLRALRSLQPRGTPEHQSGTIRIRETSSDQIGDMTTVTQPQQRVHTQIALRSSVCWKSVLVVQSCLIRLPDSSVHGILKTRILEWIAISFSRGSSPPRARTWVSWIAGKFFTIWVTREAPNLVYLFLQILYIFISFGHSGS